LSAQQLHRVSNVDRYGHRDGQPNVGSRPEQVSIDAEFAAITKDVVRELGPVFSPQFGEVFVVGQVRKAINELRGSVCAESLPEMVARLACHRLTARLTN
jgi:hypothetical protein